MKKTLLILSMLFTTVVVMAQKPDPLIYFSNFYTLDKINEFLNDNKAQKSFDFYNDDNRTRENFEDIIEEDGENYKERITVFVYKDTKNIAVVVDTIDNDILITSNYEVSSKIAKAKLKMIYKRGINLLDYVMSNRYVDASWGMMCHHNEIKMIDWEKEIIFSFWYDEKSQHLYVEVDLK